MRERCVPLRMHSGGVDIGGRPRSGTPSNILNVFSWGPVFGSGPTDTMLYFIWAVWQHQMWTTPAHNTYNAFGTLMRWSFTALWRGRWPTHDHLGKKFEPGQRGYEMASGTGELADGYFALLWGIESDLDFLAGFWNFPRMDSAAFCAFCPCTDVDGQFPWNNFKQSVWRSAIPGCN